MKRRLTILLFNDWLSSREDSSGWPPDNSKAVQRFWQSWCSAEGRYRQDRRFAGLSEQLAQTISDFVIPKDEILRDIEMLAKLHVRVITRWDPDYPSNHKEIYDPPALLFVRGEIKPEDSRGVAIVGTRNPTRTALK